MRTRADVVTSDLVSLKLPFKVELTVSFCCTRVVLNVSRGTGRNWIQMENRVFSLMHQMLNFLRANHGNNGDSV